MKQNLPRTALYHIGIEVHFDGEKGVVVGRYWRRRTQQVLYDVKVIRNDGFGPIVIHPKVPEEALVKA